MIVPLLAVLVACLIFGVSHVQAAPPIIRDYRLVIPAIGFDQAVIKAPVFGNTWNFVRIRETAAYLEGRPLPGTNNNVAIGAHSEFEKRRRGPFFDLDQLRVGDEIIVRFNGATFRYEVETLWVTTPDDARPIAQTDSEMLTLFTCSAYNPDTSHYELRLIVRARFTPVITF